MDVCTSTLPPTMEKSYRIPQLRALIGYLKDATCGSGKLEQIRITFDKGWLKFLYLDNGRLLLHQQSAISSHKTVLHAKFISSWRRSAQTKFMGAGSWKEGSKCKEIPQSPVMLDQLLYHHWSSLQRFCGFASYLGRRSLNLYRNNQHVSSQTNLAVKVKRFEYPSARGLLLLSLMQKVGLLMLGHQQPSACFHFHRWLLHSTPLQSATCDHRSPAVRVYTLYPVSPSFCPTM